MPSNRRSILALSMVFIFGIVPILAQQQSDRVKTVGSRFLCMCNCNQVLTQCNHVGCTVSTSMLKELGGWIARGDSDAAITAAFVKEYTTTVYAEPPKSGFSLVAWSMPFVYFIAGATLVIFLIRKWRSRPATVLDSAPGGIAVSSEAMDRARAQAARETDD
jgi:cytochrome c-type biogenesis protein CcmH/NrfF